MTKIVIMLGKQGPLQRTSRSSVPVPTHQTYNHHVVKKSMHCGNGLTLLTLLFIAYEWHITLYRYTVKGNITISF